MVAGVSNPEVGLVGERGTVGSPGPGLRGARVRGTGPVRPLPLVQPSGRDRITRRLGYTGRSGPADVPDPAGNAGLAGDLPPSIRTGQVGSHSGSRLERTGRTGDGRRLVRGRAHHLRLPLPAHR